MYPIPPKPWLAILLSGWFLSGLKSQTITISTDHDRATFVVDPEDALPNQGSGFTLTPFQEVFWIYGDGNFRKDTILPGANLSYTHTRSYFTDQANSIFNVFGVVNERKTDNPPSKIYNFIPPGLPGLGTSITIPAFTNEPAEGDDFIQYTSAIPGFDPSTTQRVGISSSLFADNHYFIENQSVAALAIAGVPPASRGSLILLYNDTPDLNAANISGFKDNPQWILSKYGNVTLSAAPEALLDYYYGPQNAYNKTYKYSFSSSDKLIDQPGKLEGLRMFCLLQAGNDVENSSHPFLVLLTSPDQTDWNNLGNKNYNEDEAFLNGFVDANSGLVVFSQPGVREYFVDAAYLVMERNGEPIDPNHLRITNICHCGNNDYKISFTLSFENIGDAANTGANVLLQDLTGHFYCIQPDTEAPFEVIGNGQNTFGSVDVWGNCTQISEQPGYYTGWEGKFCLGNYSLLPHEKAMFRFSARTTRAGLLDLFIKTGALKACVEFHETLGEPPVCAANAPLDTTTYSDPKFGNSKDRQLWADRNKPCSNACSDCCMSFLCLVAGLAVDTPVLTMAMLFFLVLLSIGIIRWKRR